MEATAEQIAQNIARLREKVGDARTGGKGSQRRKVKVVSKPQGGSNDKVIKNLVKKMGAQQIGVDEINFFRDDNTILHFSRPESYASIQNNTFVVCGEPETKTIKDLLPGIIDQLGPKQSKFLQELVQGSTTATEQIPNLVDAKDNLNKVE